MKQALMTKMVVQCVLAGGSTGCSFRLLGVQQGCVGAHVFVGAAGFHNLQPP
jgi:hypothetical protein